MKKIKIAQIGIGHDHALELLNCILKHPDIFEFVGLAIPESEKSDFPTRYDRVAKYNTLTVEEALNYEGLEAIAIETEELNLTKYTQMAADRGLHIHMDKPGGADLAEFERMIETVKKNNCVLSLGYMYRYNSEVMELYRKIEAGELGEIYAVEAHMDCFHKLEKRQWLARFPGGMLFVLGCHLIDFVYRIQGEPAEIIPMSMSTGIDGVTGQDLGMALFKYKNGISFVKTSAIECGGFMRRQLVVCGSKGTVELHPLERYLPGTKELVADVYECFETTPFTVGPKHRVGEPQDRYDHMMEAFAAMVRGEKTNPYTPDYELALYKVVLRACGA